PQIALLSVRRPQTRKPAFDHQLQNMGRVSFVRLLLAHVTGSDLRCIPDPDLVSQILHQFDEPLAVARGLHANQHRRRQLLIEQLGVPRSMHQLLFPGLSRLRVQPRNLLPAGMEITPYNHHAKTPYLPSVFDPQHKTTGFESSLRSYPISPSSAWAGPLMSQPFDATPRSDLYPFSSQRRCTSHQRPLTARRRQWRSTCGARPSCARQPRRPSKLPQPHQSALFDNTKLRAFQLSSPARRFRHVHDSKGHGYEE